MKPSEVEIVRLRDENFKREKRKISVKRKGHQEKVDGSQNENRIRRHESRSLDR